MFKYFTFSNRIRFLFAMFERTATDLFIFMIVLFIFVFPKTVKLPPIQVLLPI